MVIRFQKNGQAFQVKYQNIKYYKNKIVIFTNLSGSIDAVCTYGKVIYFFKGSLYWRFYGNQIEQGFPRNISHDFRGVPDNLDAAMNWGGKSMVRFFKEDKYWSIDLKLTFNKTIQWFSKPITDWKGISKNIDAAIEYPNGCTRFFVNNIFYDYKNFSVFFV